MATAVALHSFLFVLFQDRVLYVALAALELSHSLDQAGLSEICLLLPSKWAIMPGWSTPSTHIHKHTPMNKVSSFLRTLLPSGLHVLLMGSGRFHSNPE